MSDRQNYIAVTSSYWGFTVTDGALRMLVLLHFHTLGFSPIDLASLFILYELMGVFTNFFGGWIGSRYGLRVTLYAGLLIQIVALIMLSNIRADWLISASAVYVMLTQALSGVAKDLTKMSSKSTVKVVVGSGNQGLLFKWVAILTGSKNAFKGVGFFVGSWLSGLIVDYFAKPEGTHTWNAIWLVPAVGAALILVLFASLFKETPRSEVEPLRH